MIAVPVALVFTMRVVSCTWWIAPAMGLLVLCVGLAQRVARWAMRGTVAMPRLSAEDLECCICKEPNHLPLVSTCGHAMCEKCVGIMFHSFNNDKNTSTPKCATCRADVIFLTRCFPLKSVVDAVYPDTAGAAYGFDVECKARGGTFMILMRLSDLFRGDLRYKDGRVVTADDCRNAIEDHIQLTDLVTDARTNLSLIALWAAACVLYALPHISIFILFAPFVCIIFTNSIRVQEVFVGVLGSIVMAMLVNQLIATPWIIFCVAGTVHAFSLHPRFPQTLGR